MLSTDNCFKSLRFSRSVNFKIEFVDTSKYTNEVKRRTNERLVSVQLLAMSVVRFLNRSGVNISIHKFNVRIIFVTAIS